MSYSSKWSDFLKLSINKCISLCYFSAFSLMWIIENLKSSYFINNIPISQLDLEKRIYTIRGVHVMLDSDLAEIYGMPTSRLNEQVKSNIERFPEDFVFKLSIEEWEHLISQFATSSQNN